MVIVKLSEKRLSKKKKQILASAIEIINRKGYNGATMEEIAAELLMTKGSLYYYFKNKSDLMYQCHNFVLSQATDELRNILNQAGSTEERSIKEFLQLMIAAHIKYAIKEKETFNLIMEPKQFFNKEQLVLVLQLRREYEGLFEEIISRGMKSGEFSVEEPAFIRMFILGSMNWVQQWYKPNGRLTIDELTALYSQYIIKLLK
ncbi:TetR/AcrR family transcriptional regulator [Alkalihalophilus pseudofirmus]|uniref:TetR/AcrR family transcriptional regulator n=1 Tax=Alkalihalophilus pseudofirmus TaxID=79885 RepID=UPI00259B8CA8|nr:TetR/AcrR family transcriptional regulator [Alkalihalophilus pseudofirmus]WEG15201.1 TetR/AcrR family transcriptional regulator [Alkalihalophilus pseudofirmus]